MRDPFLCRNSQDAQDQAPQAPGVHVTWCPVASVGGITSDDSNPIDSLVVKAFSSGTGRYGSEPMNMSELTMYLPLLGEVLSPILSLLQPHIPSEPSSLLWRNGCRHLPLEVASKL